MNESRRIKSALISVYHKDNLSEIASKLHSLGVKLYSTGGTKDFLESLNLPVTAVESLTQYPSIFGGRVKTLHPKVFGGILNRRENENDRKEAAQFDIPDIDLVIVDLYPFEETVKSGADQQSIIEKIDIGGISLIRAAAKNFKDVIIVPSKAEYTPLLNLLNEKNGESSIEDRMWFANRAFSVSSHYDSAIFNYFNSFVNEPFFRSSFNNGKELRYGENPHQKGWFFGDFDNIFQQIHGKEISYNNLLDIEAAYGLINEFSEKPACAIFKHNNACGMALGENLLSAWQRALTADPISAFGGIIAVNRKVDLMTADEMNNLFFEVIIAPGYDDDALQLLKSKKNRIILIQKQAVASQKQFRSVLGGVLVQESDHVTETPDMLKCVTKVAPTEAEIKDLLFANILVKHTKSNAIVLAKNQQLIGSGTGQMSRVDSLCQAIDKAKQFGFHLEGAVMASDAFFPFPDCVEIADKEGIHAVIHPGGSIRDGESVEYCDNHGMAMVTTGIRHFKH